ncbi:MAG: KH domain-containing protein [Candidatus Thalassarchaeaceae archaeon]|tara:strand:- start:1190 stop:1924 length:735 start_codon:yes stop_codon:yes gene_type:complete
MEPLTRIPKERIAVLIGKGGATRKMIEDAAGVKIHIDSESGEVSATWPEDADPVHRIKLPDIIRAIGRGLAPSRAVRLISDDTFLRMYDIREWVGRRGNHTRRMRSRLIGRDGKIRTLIEGFTGTEIAIHGSTVVVIGDEAGLMMACTAIEGLLDGAEHSTVIRGMEKDGRRRRIEDRSLESYQIRESEVDVQSGFEDLVPGLSDARNRRNRRFKNSQVDMENQSQIDDMVDLEDDESIIYSEE